MDGSHNTSKPYTGNPLMKFHFQQYLLATMALLVIHTSLLAAPPNAPAEKIKYARDIAPLFARHCLDCHGPDLQESEFRVDRRDSLLKGGDTAEPAVVPNDVAKSHLLERVTTTDENLQMPPDGPALSPKEIKLLTQWIEQGAILPETDSDELKLETDHWSFQPLTKVKPPQINNDWADQPFDAFVLEQLHQKKLSPSKPAERKDLIRRLYLVMLGLPPSPEVVQQFIDDQRPDDYQRLIEKVLASPRYGERWARHWLDIVHFGETQGYETNRERPTAWHYRDYVIQSLNEDKPYDQFIKEQIAGDALGVDVGTGFLVAGPHDIVKSPDINLTLAQRQDDLTDIINTTGTTFLGLTLGCAKCHNHKFDPITQKDFYSFQAVFAGVQHEERRVKFAPDSKEAVEQAKLQAETQKLQQQLKQAGARKPVNSLTNEEIFPSILASKVRFTILATSTGAGPCLDELEIFGSDKSINVALHTTGTKLTASSTIPGYPIHQLKHLNDGKHGNANSWISNERGKGWVELEFPQPQNISRIVWGRDKQNRYHDRIATKYKFEIQAPDSDQWEIVASSLTRLPMGDQSPSLKDQQAELQQANLTTQQLEQLQNLTQQHEQLKQRQAELNKQLPKMYIGKFTQPGDTYRLYRGEPMAKREQVEPNTLAVLGSLNLKMDAPEQLRRVRLAEWIASPDNPLTARVIVNRLWQFHFGTGIVDTPSDFGANGTAPTHPELLDWLAQELIDHNWSLKHIHRLILSSNTYQQTSQPNSESLAIDADARYLWRFPPRRLEAEIIRDSIITASGVIDLKMGGRGFSGFDVEPENVMHFHPKEEFGPEDFRRMIYMTKIRQEQDSVFGAFDCPDASQVMPKRSRSTTPLQALNLYNSNFVLQQADLFSKRLQEEAPNNLSQQIDRAFALCYQREPTTREREATLHFAQQHSLPAVCRALLNSNEFLFIP